MEIGKQKLCFEEQYYESRKIPEQELVNFPRLFNINTKEEIKEITSKYARSNPELELISNHEFSITLKNNSTIKVISYPILYRFYDEIKNKINKLLKLGIIRKSFSPYGSPPFAIAKKNGTIRLVVDYRRLNESLDDPDYPFPDMWDQIKSIPASNVFLQLDITMGNHNVRIKEENIKKTAFVMLWDQYEYTRIPFGIKTAP